MVHGTKCESRNHISINLPWIIFFVPSVLTTMSDLNIRKFRTTVTTMIVSDKYTAAEMLVCQ